MTSVGNQLSLIGHAYDALRCAPIGSDGFENTAEHLLELVAELWTERHKPSSVSESGGERWQWWPIGDNKVILRRVQ